MISRKTFLNLQKLLAIVVLWLLIAVIITAYDSLLLGTLASSGTGNTPLIITNLSFNFFAALMGSLIGGSFLIFYVNDRLRTRPYIYSLLAVSIAFIMIVLVVTFTLSAVAAYLAAGTWPFGSELATSIFYDHLHDPLHFKNVLVWYIVTMLTQFFLQVSDKFGPGLMWGIVSGKYQVPRNERRVFMFLDLMDSTTIAERLGNNQYYSLLRDFFADITNSILLNGGNIYQYVGDEVVVSWTQKEAFHNFQCINCYFDIREKIDQLTPKYELKYGVAPDFKAAFHQGEVTAGEIGIIKRDITYSGDVLNTTSRILSKCNEYKQKLLVSGSVQSHVNHGRFSFQPMGYEVLKGKKEKVEIYAVHCAQDES